MIFWIRIRGVRERFGLTAADAKLQPTRRVVTEYFVETIFEGGEHRSGHLGSIGLGSEELQVTFGAKSLASVSVSLIQRSR
jgi:hypothetical protein